MQTFCFRGALCLSRYSMPIVDEDRRVLLLCAGTDAEDWARVAEDAAKAMEDARGRIR